MTRATRSPGPGASGLPVGSADRTTKRRDGIEPGGAVAATVGGFVAIGLWSSTVALARSLSESLGPLTAGAAVYGMAGALALAAAGARRRRAAPPDPSAARAPTLPVLVCGALFVGYAVLLFAALGWARDHTQALEVGLLNYLWPALTLWFSIALLGFRAHWGLAPATLMALAGVGLVLTHDTTLDMAALARRLTAAPVPYALGTAAAIAWALYSNLTRRWAAAMGSGVVPVYLAATGLGLGVLCLGADEPRRWSARAGAEAAALALATWLAYGLWERAMMRGRVALVASAAYATPLLSTLIACAYLSVRPGPRLWVGCALLIAGAVASKRAIRPPEPVQAADRPGERPAPRS